MRKTLDVQITLIIIIIVISMITSWVMLWDLMTINDPIN